MARTKKTDEQKAAEKAKKEAAKKAAAENKKEKTPEVVNPSKETASLNMVDKGEGKVYKLKLATRHPNNAFRLGKHVVTHLEGEFLLTPSEEKELQTPGPKKFIKIL